MYSIPLQTKDNLVIRLLEEACKELDITPTQFEAASTAYESLAKWLSAEDSELKEFCPDLFPQGSMRLGTVVKPEGSNEFDVDMVCTLMIMKRITSDEVYQMILRRLMAHGTYKNMIEPKNRCIRIVRKDEFHVDITPAIPAYAQYAYDGSLFVPDRELVQWKPSNPRLYADWVEKIAAMKPQFGLFLPENRISKSGIEELPDDSGFYKAPLKRIIQILKRNRDICFKDNKDIQVISIIITTLAARAYQSVVERGGSASLYHFLREVVDLMPSFIEIKNGEYCIPNPVIITENFAEKWNSVMDGQEKREAFFQWHKSLKATLTEIENSEGKGLEVLVESSGKMLGENIAKSAASKGLGYSIYSTHQSGGVSINRSGAISTIGVCAPKNTYHGKP